MASPVKRRGGALRVARSFGRKLERFAIVEIFLIDDARFGHFVVKIRCLRGSARHAANTDTRRAFGDVVDHSMITTVLPTPAPPRRRLAAL